MLSDRLTAGRVTDAPRRVGEYTPHPGPVSTTRSLPVVCRKSVQGETGAPTVHRRHCNRRSGRAHHRLQARPPRHFSSGAFTRSSFNDATRPRDWSPRTQLSLSLSLSLSIVCVCVLLVWIRAMTGCEHQHSMRRRVACRQSSQSG